MLHIPRRPYNGEFEKVKDVRTNSLQNGLLDLHFATYLVPCCMR